MIDDRISDAVGAPIGTIARVAALGAACALLAILGCAPRQTHSTVDWSSFEGGDDSAHFSPLVQITKTNVARLTPVWRYDVGEHVLNAQPLIVNGIAYILGANGSIVALDGRTGQTIWSKPEVAAPGMRGLSYWRSADGSSERIFYVKNDHLLALDARTGTPIGNLATDLKAGLDRDPATIRRIQSNTPGRVVGDLIVMGSATGEDYGSPAGDIRAYDTRTGALVWRFKTIPDDSDRLAAPTWGKNPRAVHGGTNDWAGMSVDARRGIVYVVTGAPTYDFWGADRPGNNLYADCIIALDVHTGRRLWHFQTVHHDLWDYDLAASPVLLTVRRGGKAVDAVAVATKTGFVFVFDRASGKPLFPIEERPVPQGGLAGEWISPTQPFPAAIVPFARQRLRASDLDPALPPAEAAAIAARIGAARNDGVFTPPSTRETVEMPGSNGGANWGAAAADPHHGLFYVVSFDVPAMTKLQFVDPAKIGGVGATSEARGRSMFMTNCAGCHGADRRGHPPTVPSLIDVAQHMPPEVVTDTIHQGRGQMPAFASLIGEPLHDLLHFIGVESGTGRSPTPRKIDLQPRWRTDYGYLFARSGNPAIAPPWSTLTAYDLNEGKRLWQIPLGTDPAYPLAHAPDTGTGLTKLGVIVTGGGLLFAATSRDRRLLAFDAASGKTLLEMKLPAAAAGIPASYAIDGRQYLLVPVAASGGKIGHERPGVAPARNGYVAFALPDRKR